MKKILDSLLSIITLTIPLTGVISCGSDGGQRIKPADYNLTPYLIKLNTANFKVQNHNVDLKKYDFLNSWFNNVSFADSIASYSKIKVSQEWDTVLYKTVDAQIDNQSDTDMNIILPSADIQIPNNENNLRTEFTLDTSQKIFTILGDHFNSQNQYIMNENKFSDNTFEEYKIKQETVVVPPKHSEDVYDKLTMHQELSSGITSFPLNLNTQINYQVKDLATGKILTYSYFLQTIMDDSSWNNDYKDFISNNNFFSLDKNDIKNLVMNVPSIATLITHLDFSIVAN